MDDDTIAFGEEEEAAQNANKLKYIWGKCFLTKVEIIVYIADIE